MKLPIINVHVHPVFIAEHKVIVKKVVVAVGLISAVTLQGEVAVWVGVATNLYWLFKL